MTANPRLLTPLLALALAACGSGSSATTNAAPAGSAPTLAPTFAPATPAPGGPAELQVYAAASLKAVLAAVKPAY